MKNKSAIKLNKGLKSLIKVFGSRKKLAEELCIKKVLFHIWLYSKVPLIRMPHIIYIMKKHDIKLPLHHFNADYFDAAGNIKPKAPG